MDRRGIFNKAGIAWIVLLAALLFASCTSEPPSLASGFGEPENPRITNDSAWVSVSPGLQGGFGSTNTRYSRNNPPAGEIIPSWHSSSWRGEVVSAQLVLWSAQNINTVQPGVTGLYDSTGNEIDRSWLQIRPVRYLLTDEFLTGCGHRDADTIPVHLVADILDTLTRFNIPARSVRPLWITVSVPPDVRPGRYSGTVTIRSATDSTLSFSLSLDVKEWLLPPSEKWSFHLDLWQNPFAVARYHQAELWSQEHLDLLKPLLTLLAGAGQKCITTSIVDMPWGGQTYDPFKSMITWIKNSDGRWEFDYSAFDQYVMLAMKCGITRQINCYSMVPWGNRFRYYEEDSSEFVVVEAKPGTPEYEDLWRPFLYDFRTHLMEMGWLEITTIAMDERGPEEMDAMISFIKRTTPEFRITLAGHYHPQIINDLYDFSYNWRHIRKDTPDVIRQRKKRGQVTTYYVACGIPCPNNFTFSPPAESVFEGWFAAAMGFDGFLRWAYNSWVEDPLTDSRFRTWPAGDTYLVYPGPRSSIRFEKLREGIADYEKIRILRNILRDSPSPEITRKLETLDLFLGSIRQKPLSADSIEKILREGKALLHEVEGI